MNTMRRGLPNGAERLSIRYLLYAMPRVIKLPLHRIHLTT